MLFYAALVAGFSALATLQSSTDFIDSPALKLRGEKTCKCPTETETPALTLIGLVVDAELTLGEDGRSVNDRQTTIFNVAPAIIDGDTEVSGRIKVSHNASKASCGVTFDYGKNYSVPVRKTENGDYETDICLGEPSAKADQ